MDSGTFSSIKSCLNSKQTEKIADLSQEKIWINGMLLGHSFMQMLTESWIHVNAIDSRKANGSI